MNSEKTKLSFKAVIGILTIDALESPEQSSRKLGSHISLIRGSCAAQFPKKLRRSLFSLWAQPDRAFWRLEDVSSIAKESSIPVILDACNEVLPDLSNVAKFFDRGADLLVLSGGKTIQGPNDTGIICGRKDLVEACRANSYPHMNGIGRAMKVSKEQIVGILTSLEVFSEMIQANGRGSG